MWAVRPQSTAWPGDGLGIRLPRDLELVGLQDCVVDGTCRLGGGGQDDPVSRSCSCPLAARCCHVFVYFLTPALLLGWHQKSLCRGAAFSQGGQGPGAPEGREESRHGGRRD